MVPALVITLPAVPRLTIPVDLTFCQKVRVPVLVNESGVIDIIGTPIEPSAPKYNCPLLMKEEPTRE